MPTALKLEFAPLAAAPKGVLIVLCEEGLKYGSAARKAVAASGDLLARAAAAENFKGKSGSALELVAPTGLDVARLVVLGVGKGRDLKSQGLVRLGGVAMAKIPGSASAATIIAELAGGPLKPDQASELALGVRLRAYAFDRYKTKRKEDDERPKEVKVAIAVASVPAAEKAYASRAAVADGVVLARDLVNEPANVLYPEEFARRTGNLKKVGVQVEVLDVAAMKKLGMNALLGVGQGSEHESQ